VTEHDRYAPLRAVLEHEFRIEQVLQETAAGAVYLARDLTLDRRVLVKALDPASAGDARTTEFAREAKVLASLSDPGIPAIHHAGLIGDFHFVVLEHPGGETLERRLRHGPLSPDEILRLGVQMLGALETAHAAGFVHSAVIPRNVIVADGRYLLDGFGTATAASDGAALGDLQAVGRLLGEAGGGGLPRPVRAAVERALSRDPAERAPSATAFREALETVVRHPAPRRRGRLAAFGAVLAAGAIYGIGRELERPGALGPAPRELAVLPLEVDGSQPLDPLGLNLAHLIQLNLEEVPGLGLTPRGQVDRWWEAQGGEASAVDGFSAARALRVHWVAHGLVDRRPGNVLRVRLSLYDSAGATSVLPEVRGPGSDLAALGDSISLSIIRVVAPRSDKLYEPVGGFAGVPLAALKAFLQGEAAFARDAWALAQRHYEIALGVDSTFALADWRLANVRHWRRLPPGIDLAAVYQRHSSRLRPRDRMLIQALLEPDLEIRFTKLDSVIRRLPGDGYARLLQGEELFHRGPLTGRGLDQALPVMAAAVARDSSLALAHDHLVLGHIRFGRRQEARSALGLRRRVGQADRHDDLDLVPFLELVYDERFVPWRAWARFRYIAWRQDPRQLDGIERIARTGTPWLDMPRTQLRYCDLLLRAGRPSAEAHATAHEGKGLALFALGRLDEALAEIDSAVALFDSPEARLQQAEWRVIPHALGLPGAGTRNWELRLAAMADDSSVGSRAAWALALARLAAGDTSEARRWSERLPAGHPLRALIDAGRAAAAGDFALALTRTDSVRLQFQVTRPPDPFAGAVFHLLRGDWLAASGEPARADREWLWYEGSDVEGWPEGLSQAGEVDAALGVFARLKRARALLAPGSSTGDSLRACSHLGRIGELWSEVEPPLRPLVDEAAALARGCPP
jgi:tetratricopeptide (TPR) repeat protein